MVTISYHRCLFAASFLDAFLLYPESFSSNGSSAQLQRNLRSRKFPIAVVIGKCCQHKHQLRRDNGATVPSKQFRGKGKEVRFPAVYLFFLTLSLTWSAGTSKTARPKHDSVSLLKGLEDSLWVIRVGCTIAMVCVL